MGLFGANRAYFYLINYDLQEVFLSKTKSTSLGINVLDANACNKEVSFGRYMCFFISAE
jgi:hypothetical protein